MRVKEDEEKWGGGRERKAMVMRNEKKNLGFRVYKMGKTQPNLTHTLSY